jgi:hypothetical protein
LISKGFQKWYMVKISKFSWYPPNIGLIPSAKLPWYTHIQAFNFKISYHLALSFIWGVWPLLEKNIVKIISIPKPSFK